MSAFGVKRTQHDFSVHPRKKSPGGISPCRGFIVSGAGTAFLHRHIPEVRRFISRKQVKMKLASGSPSGLVGGSTGIFGNAVLAPPRRAFGNGG
jgi:hypothetical protein